MSTTTTIKLSELKSIELQTIDAILRQYRSGVIKSDMAYQRPEKSGAWAKPEHQDKLIYTILRGESIGILHIMREFDAPTEQLADGKQRVTLLNALKSGNYIVTTLPEAYDMLNGLDFSSWPQEYQDKVNNYVLPILASLESDESIIADWFNRFTGGAVKLTLAQVNRGRLLPFYKAHAQIIAQLGNKLTDAAMAQGILLKLNALCNNNFNFASSNIIKLAIDSDNIDTINLARAIETLDKTIDHFDIKIEGAVLKRVLKPTHIVSCLWLLYSDPDISAVRLYKTLSREFAQLRDEKSQNKKDYDSCNQSKTAEPATVERRIVTFKKLVCNPIYKLNNDIRSTQPSTKNITSSLPRENQPSNVLSSVRDSARDKMRNKGNNKANKTSSLSDLAVNGI